MEKYNPGHEERNVLLVQDLIRRRLASFESPYPKPRRLPQVAYPQSVQTLLNEQGLWLDVEGDLYTPRKLVTSLLVRKDGGQKTKDAFSVFIAMQKDFIEKKWNIVAKSTWSKQKNQYWDRHFVEALFTNMLLHDASRRSTINKIAYGIVPEVELQALRMVFAEAIERSVV